MDEFLHGTTPGLAHTLGAGQIHEPSQTWPPFTVTMHAALQVIMGAANQSPLGALGCTCPRGAELAASPAGRAAPIVTNFFLYGAEMLSSGIPAPISSSPG